MATSTEECKASNHMPIDSSEFQDKNSNSDTLCPISKHEDTKDKESCIMKKRQKKLQLFGMILRKLNYLKVKKIIIMCPYCKDRLFISGKGASTSHLKRHSQNCLPKKLHTARQKKQTIIPFRSSSNLANNPFVTPGVKYSNEQMREIIATTIMVHE